MMTASDFETVAVLRERLPDLDAADSERVSAWCDWIEQFFYFLSDDPSTLPSESPPSAALPRFPPTGTR
jgi:hypothetical protein